MGWGRDLALGAVAGYGASRVMDRVTTAFQERQSESSRRREREVQEEMATTVLVKKLAQSLGRKIDEHEAERLGGWVHYGMGVSTGVSAALMVHRGMPAFRAGVASALTTWLLVDEVANPVLGLTPAATDYPVVTHVRGFVGHLALGLTIGSFFAIRRVLFGKGTRT
jgi:hypothetical protein